VYFRDRLFVLDREAPPTASEREELVLRVKKAVYEEEAKLGGLRAAVANMEAAVEYQRSGPRRDAIPEDVKLVVWARDGGRCVRCGAQRPIHFDHIIPVARGGGNIAANIQLLCQTCNLKKSDRIAMP
jgi:HNH endonuclease